MTALFGSNHTLKPVQYHHANKPSKEKQRHAFAGIYNKRQTLFTVPAHCLEKTCDAVVQMQTYSGQPDYITQSNGIVVLKTLLNDRKRKIQEMKNYKNPGQYAAPDHGPRCKGSFRPLLNSIWS